MPLTCTNTTHYTADISGSLLILSFKNWAEHHHQADKSPSTGFRLHFCSVIHDSIIEGRIWADQEKRVFFRVYKGWYCLQSGVVLIPVVDGAWRASTRARRWGLEHGICT